MDYFCPQCKAPISRNDIYCLKCGLQLKPFWTSVQQEEDTVQAKAQAEQNAVKTMKKKRAYTALGCFAFLIIVVGLFAGGYGIVHGISKHRQTVAGKAKIYKLGDRGPGNGAVFYDKGYYSEGWRYLECAPVICGRVQWFHGSYIDSVPGLKTEIGKGDFNTYMIVSTLGSSADAAYMAMHYTGGGKNDWYLGNVAEMKTLYENLTKHNKRKVKKLKDFEKLRSSIFDDYTNSYWTSEQDRSASNKAYQVYFESFGGYDLSTEVDGDIGIVTGDMNRHDDPVRPIRKF